LRVYLSVSFLDNVSLYVVKEAYNDSNQRYELESFSIYYSIALLKLARNDEEA